MRPAETPAPAAQPRCVTGANYAALERLAQAARGYAHAAFEQPIDSQAAVDRVDFWREELLAALRAAERAGLMG